MPCPGSCLQHCPQTSPALQGQLETPACEQPAAQGVLFHSRGTPVPAQRAKVLYMAPVMVTKLLSANTKGLLVCWGDLSWGEMEGVLLPCLLLNSPQKLQARMPINANWDFFFICGHVSIRNSIDSLRQVTHFVVAIK